MRFFVRVASVTQFSSSLREVKSTRSVESVERVRKVSATNTLLGNRSVYLSCFLRDSVDTFVAAGLVRFLVSPATGKAC